jgi:hypothetical protein
MNNYLKKPDSGVHRNDRKPHFQNFTRSSYRFNFSFLISRCLPSPWWDRVGGYIPNFSQRLFFKGGVRGIFIEGGWQSRDEE